MTLIQLWCSQQFLADFLGKQEEKRAPQWIKGMVAHGCSWGMCSLLSDGLMLAFLMSSSGG